MGIYLVCMCVCAIKEKLSVLSNHVPFFIHFPFPVIMVNIANEAGSFFQTDAELKKQKEKEAKYNYTEGECIQLSTKALGLIVLQSGKYAYVAESGFNAKRINLEVRSTHPNKTKE